MGLLFLLLVILFSENTTARRRKISDVIWACLPQYPITAVQISFRISIHFRNSFIVRENKFSGYDSPHNFAYLFGVNVMECKATVFKPKKIIFCLSLIALQATDVVIYWTSFCCWHKPSEFERRKCTIGNFYQCDGWTGWMAQAPVPLPIPCQYQFISRGFFVQLYYFFA